MRTAHPINPECRTPQKSPRPVRVRVRVRIRISVMVRVRVRVRVRVKVKVRVSAGILRTPPALVLREGCIYASV
jgi:hypothetical protein